MSAKPEISFSAIYQCPGCGYLISLLELQSAAKDFGCGRCGTSFSEFRFYERRARVGEAVVRVPQ